MKKWVCKVCGYIYEGPEAPAECPVCHAKSNMFEEVKGEMKLAAEHEFGVYAKTVKNNDQISEEDKKYIFDQLMANFNGECSEVGMYLCMARIAHREGYPEIGLYWEKAAYEEAEHAAKFAELLGSDLESNMTDSTKKNLAWRVDCEFGATNGKFELAACAKKNGPRRGPPRQGSGGYAEAVLQQVIFAKIEPFEREQGSLFPLFLRSVCPACVRCRIYLPENKSKVSRANCVLFYCFSVMLTNL